MLSKNSIETPSVRVIQECGSEWEEGRAGSKKGEGWGESGEQGVEQNFEEGLRDKLERLRAFIGELGERRDLVINSELLEQLEIEQQVYKNVSYETVIQQTQKRIEKMAKTHKLKRNWSICDLKILIWLICKHCDRQGLSIAEVHNVRESWEFISSLIPGTSPQSCLFKWLSLKRHKITLHGWSEEEEQILLQLEKKHADSRNKWKFISEELYSRNPSLDKIYRHPKQCREHYASFLDPQIKKGPWTREQDLALLSHIVENGCEKKWCKLVKILEGRTENAIKNRFQLIFAKQKRRKENKSKPELQIITEYMRENGAEVPPLKKQRHPAANSPSPPGSFRSFSPEHREGTNLPIIPTFRFCSSSRSLPSAFTPYLEEPLFQQMREEVFYELAGGKKEEK